MSTTTISDWTVTDAADTGRPLTFTVFSSRDEAQQWVAGRRADIARATEQGYIGGVHYQEQRISAHFIATSHDALAYLGFGARVVQTVYVYDIPAIVIGVPVEHALYLCQRLSSGLIRYAGPFDALEEARQQARLGL